jgi:hypothetical protein
MRFLPGRPESSKLRVGQAKRVRLVKLGLYRWGIVVQVGRVFTWIGLFHHQQWNVLGDRLAYPKIWYFQIGLNVYGPDPTRADETGHHQRLSPLRHRRRFCGLLRRFRRPEVR